MTKNKTGMTARSRSGRSVDPSDPDVFGSTPSLHHGIYLGLPWNSAMSNFLDLHETSYYPPSMAQGLGGSVRGGSRMSGSHLGPRKPPKSGSPHLPTPDAQNLPNGSGLTTGSNSQPLKRKRPNLQLHLHISWELDLRFTPATSLLIN